MPRMKLRKKRKFDKLSALSVVIILLMLSIFLTLSYINKKISPILLNFAEIETSKIANLIINKAITKHITSGVDIEKLFTTVQNKDGEIQTIDFNTVIVNKILNTSTNSVQLNLKALEQGKIDSIELPEEILVEYDKEKLKKGIIYEIPLGAVTRNAFLSNLGPKIPVRLNLIGSVLSNINTKINQYGINNALIEIAVRIEVIEQVNLPFMSKRVKVSSDVPIAMKVINGKIPEYYYGSGLNQNSPILTVPVE